MRKRLSRSDKERVIQLSGGCCHICGFEIRGSTWEREHVIPLSMGGKDEVANIRMAHPRCHAEKTDRDKANLAKARARQALERGTKADSPWRPFPRRPKPPRIITKPPLPRREPVQS